MEVVNDDSPCIEEEFLVNAASLQKLAIDTSDIETAATMIASVRDVYETIPEHIRGLRQFVPVVAIYQSKLASLKNRLMDAFINLIEIGDSGYRVHVNHELYDVDKLWASAVKLDYQTTISRHISARLSDSILRNLLDDSDDNALSCEVDGSIWSLKAATGHHSGSVPEHIYSLFLFLKTELFESVDPQTHLFEQFLRVCWCPLSRTILRKFKNGPPDDQFCDIEEKLLTNFSTDPPSAVLGMARDEWRNQDSSRKLNATLELIRTRILSDLVNKVTHTPSPPNKDMIDELGFYPNLVSETCMWIVSDCLSTTTEGIPSIVALFLLMRRPEFSDPEALNGRNMAIFFQDCSYLCLRIAMMASEASDSEQASSLRDQIGIVRSFVVKSVEFFTKKMMARFRARIDSCKAFSLGLVTTEQESQADECIEQCLFELANCSREWNMGVQLNKQVANLWTCTIADMLLKYMNIVVQNTANIVSGSGAPSALWGVWNRFIAAIEMLGNLTCFNSYKAAKKIQLALSGTATDINLIKDPIADDEQLFGVSATGFEKLLSCNPLLKGDSKTAIHSLVSKLVVQVNQIRNKEAETVTNRSYASLFG